MKHKGLSVLFLILLFSINILVFAKDGFNTRNAYNITKELSSDKYRGRLAGDVGNQLACDYIKEYFKKIGLKPGGDKGSYLQSFEVYVPTTTGTGYFKVYDERNTLVKEYKYGVDFKEMTYGASTPGIVSGYIKTDFRRDANILIADNINNTFENSRGYANDIQLKSNGIKAILIPADEYLRFRSPYKIQKPYDEGIVKIYISRKILPELRSFAEKSYKFEIKSSFALNHTKGSNVIGILEGREKSLPPLILSAHFDHVGMDGDNVIYPGSFDNASGTGFLLECARYLTELNQQERTIIFAAFDCEEVGLIGSKYFVKNPPMDIKYAECINFDMVGTSSQVPVSIIYSSNKSDLANEIFKISEEENIPVKISINNSSDHASFCENGISAVTLIQHDTSEIHTPFDKMDNISESGFEDVFRIFNAYLSAGEAHSTLLNTENSNPGMRYLLPGAGILIITGFLVIYITEKYQVDGK